MPQLASLDVGLNATLWFAWFLGGALLGVALAARRKLPAGLFEAISLSIIGGVLLVSAHTNGSELIRLLRLGAVLTAISVIAHIWIVVRLEPGGADDPSAEARIADAARTQVALHFIALCGLLTAGAALNVSPGLPAAVPLGLTACLAVHTAMALRYGGSHHAHLARWSALAAVGVALHMSRPPISTSVPRLHLALGLFALAVAALVGIMGPVFSRWIARRHAWRTQPERLLDPPAAPVGVVAGVLFVAASVGLIALFVPMHLISPVALAVAAIAAFIVHGRQSATGTAGWLGLVLVGEAVALAFVAWLPESGVNVLGGVAGAGIYLLWLSRFWSQQLFEGIPWTPAGRLIPTARRLGIGAGFACVPLAVQAAAAQHTDGGRTIWPAVVAGLALLLLGSMLMRDGRKSASAISTFGACVAILSAAVPAEFVLRGLGAQVPLPVLVAAACALLALRAGRRLGPITQRPACDAYIGGIVPAAAVITATIPGAYGAGWLGPLATAACVIVAVALRWRPQHEHDDTLAVE